MGKTIINVGSCCGCADRIIAAIHQSEGRLMTTLKEALDAASEAETKATEAAASAEAAKNAAEATYLEVQKFPGIVNSLEDEIKQLAQSLPASMQADIEAIFTRAKAATAASMKVIESSNAAVLAGTGAVSTAQAAAADAADASDRQADTGGGTGGGDNGGGVVEP